MAQNVTILKTSSKLVDFSTISDGEFFEYNNAVYYKTGKITVSAKSYNCYLIKTFTVTNLKDTDKVQKYNNAQVKVYD